jgi:hypothetical protein
MTTTCSLCYQRVAINRDGTVRVHLSRNRDHLGARTVCHASGATVREP